MMNRAFYLSFSFACSLLFMVSCSYDCTEYTYTFYDEVYHSMDSLREAVSFEQPRSIEQPGGLYHKDGIVFVNERGNGVHIIDNTNPANPEFVGFISIPGNFGMAAKSDFLYADSYTDLLVFDISDVRNINLIKREQHVFQNLSDAGVWFNFETEQVIDYIERSEVVEECDEGSFFNWNDDDDIAVLESADGFQASADGSGEAGSMARFVVDGDVLYTVDWSSLNVFDIAEPEDPKSEGIVNIGWGIETIFPYESSLFIGAQDGMYIFDNSDPLVPEFLSQYNHTTSCDPVVVQGDYAYVTLRSGTECQGFTNQLDIVNVSDLRNPRLSKTYQMENPHGLSVKGSCLFICEGAFGLKTFEIDPFDPTSITQNGHNQTVDAFDVITLPNVLMLVGKDGFFQYDYQCGSNLNYLSHIAVGL